MVVSLEKGFSRTLPLTGISCLIKLDKKGRQACDGEGSDKIGFSQLQNESVEADE